METFDEILDKYKRYVEVLANSYGQLDYEVVKDIEQEGLIGLWEAYQKFDSTLGVPFLGYAKMYIRGRQLDYLTNNARTIRLPANIVKTLKKGNFLITTDTISIDQESSYNTNYFSGSKNSDTGTLKDFLISDDIQVPNDNSVLYTAFNEAKLKDKAKDIILMYFGLEPYEKKHYFSEIGIKYNVSRESIRQIFEKSMKKLRKDEKFIRVARELL